MKIKKFISAMILAFVAFIASPNASAYSEEVKGLADLMNEEAAVHGGFALYDGTSIVVSFPASLLFTEDKVEEGEALILSVDDPQELAPIMIEVLKKRMGDNTFTSLANFLSKYDTNLAIRLKAGNTATLILLTPDVLMGK